MPSKAFAAVNALYSIATAATTVPVYDGLPVQWGQDFDAVFIGVETLDGTSSLAVEAHQDWAGIGAPGVYPKNEEITIRCVAYSWDGEAAAYSTLRTNVAAYVAAIENALRASDNNLTLNNTVLWASISIDGIDQAPSGSGSGVQVRFSVLCQARI